MTDLVPDPTEPLRETEILCELSNDELKEVALNPALCKFDTSFVGKLLELPSLRFWRDCAFEVYIRDRVLRHRHLEPEDVALVHEAMEKGVSMGRELGAAAISGRISVEAIDRALQIPDLLPWVKIGLAARLLILREVEANGNLSLSAEEVLSFIRDYEEQNLGFLALECAADLVDQKAEEFVQAIESERLLTVSSRKKLRQSLA